MTRLLPPLLLSLSACATTTSSGISAECETACDTLVHSCGYEAYPTVDSCEQGCMFVESEGVDTKAYETCIATAECNTFAILECEHAYGNGSE